MPSTNDHTAQGDAARRRSCAASGVQHDPAAHVLKVAVDAVLGAGFLQRLGRDMAFTSPVRCSQCGRQSPALQWRTRCRTTAQCPTTRSRGLWPGQQTRCPPRPQRSPTTVSPSLPGNDLDQAIPGRHAGHADGAQVVRQRHGSYRPCAAHRAWHHHAVLLPAAHAHPCRPGVASVAAFPPPRPPCRQSSLRPGAAMPAYLALVHAAARSGDPGSGNGGAPALAIGQRRGLCRHQLEVCWPRPWGGCRGGSAD